MSEPAPSKMMLRFDSDAMSCIIHPDSVRPQTLQAAPLHQHEREANDTMASAGGLHNTHSVTILGASWRRASRQGRRGHDDMQSTHLHCTPCIDPVSLLLTMLTEHVGL